MTASLARDLARVVGDGAIFETVPASYLRDATEVRGLTGTADAAAAPSTAEGLAELMRWCYEHGVPMTPRGGGTGYAGGAVPAGGVIVCLERMRGVRSFEPLQWRAEIEAGLPTAHLHRLARENGLYFPPDPGAGEQSQIGGNVATNAGGPHAFKYGVTGVWVTGLEVVIPPGRVVRLGSGLRKDVSAYDLKSLVVGSEGTLAVITAVDVRFIPPPERRYPVLGFYTDAVAGAAAIESCMASGIVPAALEYLDNQAVEIVRSAFPTRLPDGSCFAVIAEADGGACEAQQGRDALLEVMADGSLQVAAPTDTNEIADLWRWREGMGLAADAALGGKVSEDIVVPVDRLAEAIEGTKRIGARHELASCSWGHAGDGNLHSTFLFPRNDAAGATRARAAAEELFEMAGALGGAISGEHGIGVVKSGYLAQHLEQGAVQIHGQIKSLFDPKGLLNPGTKAAA